MLRRAAAAKINLYLHVTGRRADGYHLLDSLVAFAALHDTVEVRYGRGLTLTVDGPFAGPLEEAGGNLVLHAAQRLAAAAGFSGRARIRLVKRVPVAAGLGGGSADAAAAIRALHALWRIQLPETELAALAALIGADVPVCLAGRAAFVGGVGERLDPAPPLPPAWVVLANPGRVLATPAVFRARRGGFGKPARFTEPPADAAALAAVLRQRRNDLSEAAASLCPELHKVIAALEGAPGCLLARMSGSGATCFGLFAAAAEAARAASAIAAAEPDWWVESAALIGETDTLEAVP